MTAAIISALVGLVGSGLGAFVGLVLNNKLVVYRLEQLEKKVQAHNSLIDRMYKVEQDVELINEKISVANHRIEDLEKNG